MADRIIVMGVDFHQAPVEVREELSFTADQARELLPALVRSGPATEAMLLATCNRTEFYLGYSGGPPESALLDCLRRLRPRARALHEDCYRYVHHESAAARHLFGVAAGIRSQILGDAQIIVQVEQASQVASSAGALGPILNRTIASALRAAKCARRESTIGAAVLRSVRRTFRHTGELRMLALGGDVGDAGRDVAHHLSKLNSPSLLFATRRPEQSAAMAREFHGRSIGWEGGASRIQASDVVVAATSARLEALDRDRLSPLMAGRPTPLLIADVGVPRNADPELAALPLVHLLNLDSLQQECEETLAVRRGQAPLVESILDSEPAIKQLYLDAGQSDVLAGETGDRNPIASRHVKRTLAGQVRRLRETLLAETAPESSPRARCRPPGSDEKPEGSCSPAMRRQELWH